MKKEKDYDKKLFEAKWKIREFDKAMDKLSVWHLLPIGLIFGAVLNLAAAIIDRYFAENQAWMYDYYSFIVFFLVVVIMWYFYREIDKIGEELKKTSIDAKNLLNELNKKKRG